MLKNNTNIEIFLIGKNKITSLPSTLLQGLTQLRSFNAEEQNPKLTSIPAGFSDNLENILVVNLRNNSITSLPANLFGMMGSSPLGLMNNTDGQLLLNGNGLSSADCTTRWGAPTSGIIFSCN